MDAAKRQGKVDVDAIKAQCSEDIRNVKIKCQEEIEAVQSKCNTEMNSLQIESREKSDCLYEDVQRGVVRAERLCAELEEVKRLDKDKEMKIIIAKKREDVLVNELHVLLGVEDKVARIEKVEKDHLNDFTTVDSSHTINSNEKKETEDEIHNPTTLSSSLNYTLTEDLISQLEKLVVDEFILKDAAIEELKTELSDCYKVIDHFTTGNEDEEESDQKNVERSSVGEEDEAEKFVVNSDLLELYETKLHQSLDIQKKLEERVDELETALKEAIEDKNKVIYIYIYIYIYYFVDHD